MNPREKVAGMNEEVLGTVQGHRDGHGFVVRDDGERDIYLSSSEMRAVLHKDKVQVRIARQITVAVPKGVCWKWSAPISPSLVVCRSGVWLVALKTSATVRTF